MNIKIQEGNFVPQIEFLPLSGKEIVVAFEIAKVAIEVMKEIGNALISFAQVLGVIPNVSIEELGNRAIIAIDKGILPEKYPSVEEWVKFIQTNEWGYDSELTMENSDSDKIIMGVGVVSAGLIDKFGQLPIKEFIVTAPAFLGLFTGDRLICLAKLLQTNERVLENVIRYITGMDKSRECVDNAIDALISVEKTVEANLDDNEAYQKVINY